MNIQACLPVSSAFPSPQALLLPYRIEGRMTAGHVHRFMLSGTTSLSTMKSLSYLSTAF
jgi:hypothetical protein